MKRRFVLLPMLALLVTMLFCACSGTASDADGQITMTGEKMSLAAIAVNDNIFVLGGMSKTGESFADFEVYNVAECKWTQLESMPVERAGAAVAHHGGRLYVFGGRSSERLITRVDVFDIESGKWESAGNMPYEAWNLSAESYNNKIYLLGGISGTGNERRALDDVYIFDPGSQSWEKGPSLPSGRHDAASAAADGRIYLIGGKEGAGPDAQATDRMSMLDLENMRWSELAPLPERRVGMKGAVIGGKIYIAGGSSQGEILNTVDRYDPDTDTWTEAAKLSSDRMGHAAASIGDVLYVIGGSLNIPKSADDIRLSGTIEAVSFAKDGIGG